MSAQMRVRGPTWVLSPKQRRRGGGPITAAQGVNLDSDWLAAFHRVPSLITFSPVVINSFLPHRKALLMPIKHKPAL